VPESEEVSIHANRADYLKPYVKLVLRSASQSQFQPIFRYSFSFQIVVQSL